MPDDVLIIGQLRLEAPLPFSELAVTRAGRLPQLAISVCWQHLRQVNMHTE
jgi:hypothetical protein